MANVHTRREGGTIFMEFALVLPLLILFLIALTDLARYFTTKIILSHSAQVGLRTAQALQSLEYDPFLSDDAHYDAMRVSRRNVAAEATALPKRILAWTSTTHGRGVLTRFQHISAARDLAKDSEQLEALVLLPGESAIATNPESEKDVHGSAPSVVWRDHPDVCNPESPTCAIPRKDSRLERDYFTVNLVSRFPILVELDSKFEFIFPGVGDISIRGIAAGYRERYPQVPIIK